MTTHTAFTTLTGADAAEALSDALLGLNTVPIGVGTFEIEDGSGIWEVAGYFDAAPDIAGLALLAAIHGARDFAVSRLDDRDWVAQVRRELTPVEAGRFVVHGGHDTHRVPRHKIGLLIEAAMAFGTGHHATTLGCLLSFDRLYRSGLRPARVADIGCGTAVLAMAAAKLGPGPVLASDIDGIATATARANCRANRIGPRVRCVTAPGFRHTALRDGGPYDLIFANILANPLKRMAADMARASGAGTRVILSGILKRQARSVLAVYRGHGLYPEHVRHIGEWSTLTLCRY